MANVYHWLTGSQTDLYSGVFLTASYGAQAVTNSSRYGSDSAWEIGASTSSRAILFSGYNVDGSVALPNLGTGDITVAFWWQPNNSAYGGYGQRNLFQYSPGAAVEVYHNADLSSDTQDDYNLYASFRYGNGTPLKSKAFDIDLTGNPWIKIYASRISGAFYYTLFDATGSVITDNDGNPATWSDTTQTGNIFEASSSTPHIRIGGNFVYGQTAGGIYDDIFLTLNHGIGTGSLETDSDGYAKIDPVINSFSTSATSATNGSSVTLSWDTDFGTTLQLLKYVGGLLTNTETVTGQVSKSVTISETVSYKLRATNVYGTVDSQSVQINLSQGGNNMPKIAVADVQGLVLQKSMVDSGGGLADVMHAEDPTNSSTEDKLNVVLSNMKSEKDADFVSSDARIAADEAALAAAETSLNTRVAADEAALAAAETSLNTRVAADEAALAAEIAATDADFVSSDARIAADEAALAQEVIDRKADVDAEEAARIADVSSIDTRVAADEAALAAAEASLNTRVSADEAALAAAEASLNTRVLADENALAAEIAATDAEVVSLDTRVLADEAALAAAEASLNTRVAADEAALAAEIIQTDADFTSSDLRQANDEADLAAHIANFAWDGVNVMTIGGMAKFEFETGLSSGDPMKVTITQK